MHNPNYQKNCYHQHRILVIGGSGSKKVNVLLSLTNHQPDVDNTFLLAKNPNEPKYQLLINEHGQTDLKHCKYPNAFIEHLNDLNGFSQISMITDQIKNLKY